MKNSLWMVVAFVVLLIVAAIALVYGITTHSEPGLMDDAPRWERTAFPLRVCPSAHVESGFAGASNAVARAVETTNERLGFDALLLANDECSIQVTVGVPAEQGWMDPGGDAELGEGACDVRTSNVSGEVLALTLQHELGHCLGLAHDEWEGSIMRPQQSGTPDREFPPHITDSDRDLLREMYAE